MLRATNRPILAYFDAIKSLRLRQVALILKAGYDPNLLVNARGQNGLQYLVSYFWATNAHFRLQVPINKSAYLAIAKLLLDSGLDPNAADLLTDETVVFDAIRFNDKELVSLLLNYVDLSVRNKNGETALMCAARFGSKVVMRMLLEHLRHLEMDGYFLRQRNRFGLTALELARAENIECAKVLTKHLIAFGQHTAARPLPYRHLRAGAHRAPAAALLAPDVDSASDYESDLLAAGPYHSPVAGRSGALRAAGYPRPTPYYDPKAAEFTQYLLEQQGELSGAPADQATLSDDEDYLMGSGAGTSGGQLTRSRSCILGPSAASQGVKQQQSQSGAKFPAGSAKKGAESKSMAWDGSAGGRGSMS